MANYVTLKTAVQIAIKTNNDNEITGKILQQQLLTMINSLGSGYQLAGILRPSDTPKTDDQRIAYLAVEPGMYEHAGGFEVAELSLLMYNTAWEVHPLGVPFGSQIAADITAAIEDEKAARTMAILAEQKAREQADNALGTRVTNIEDKIPVQASSKNKLADKDFVNSSIATSTATFRGTFETLEALKATQADKNDYAFWVHKDKDGNTCYDKYTFTETWEFEYTLNNSSFTAAQWAALNSGVTANVIKALQDTDKANAKAIEDEKAETDRKVAALQSLLDSMFERVYDSDNKLIRVHSNVTISSSGDLVAGSNSGGGGTSGGAYTQLEWNTIKALTQSESGLLASAYSVKEAYNELNTAIETLAGKATNVKFTQTLTSGTKIGSITIDGKSTNIYAPTPPTEVSQLTNDSGYITGITKAMVEGVLTGNITSHTHTFASLTDKPTTISGYGITDAYTKTETDNKVAALQSLLDSMFERVYDSNNKLIRIHSNVTISSSGDLVAGDNSEGGGTSGGAYTQLEWNAIKALTQSESGLLASAYSVKEAYNELNKKATAVSFKQTIASGVEIGTITIDTTSTKIYSPSLAALMGASDIGSTSAYPYWTGSAWATKSLGSNAFTSISKVSQLTNDSGYITGITSSMVTTALGANFVQNASYATSAGDADTLDGYHHSSFAKIASANDLLSYDNEFNFVPSAFSGIVQLNYRTTGGTNGAISEYRFNNGAGVTLARITNGQFSGNAASSSKWANARTITLTGSVTGSVSIDGSGDVSLATTTNHTHSYLPLSGGALDGSIILNHGNSNSASYVYKNMRTANASGRSDDVIVVNDASDNNMWNLGHLGKGANDSYIYLGYNEYNGNNLRVSSLAVSFGNNTILHAGNYNSYAPTLTGTGASGTWGISISGNAATATNADTLDGVHFQNILERANSGSSPSGTATGWFRIAETLHNDSSGINFLLSIQRSYYYANNESYLFAISIDYDGKISITQLSGCFNNQLISKIRVDWTNGQKAYIDLYIATSTTNNTYYWYTVGNAKSYTDWTANPTLNGTAYEFTTVNGCKSDLGFTGNIVGNASSATKLQNSRTIWGQSFNGTGNVSGALSGVTDITASGTIKISIADGRYLSIDGYAVNFHAYNGGWAAGYNLFDTNNSLIGTTAGGYGEGNTLNYYYYGGTYSSPKMVILNANGNVGIGTTSPSYKLHVVGTAYATENIIAAGDLTAGSDIRYKDKIQDLRLSVHDIALAPAFTYKWNNRDDALVHIGSSAQYWLNTDAKDAVYYDKQNDFYHLNYASLALCNTIILARGMETQEEKIARLEKRINELEDKLRQYDSSR